MASGDRPPSTVNTHLSPFDTFAQWRGDPSWGTIDVPKPPSAYDEERPQSFAVWTRKLREKHVHRQMSMEECLSRYFQVIKRYWGEEDAKRAFRKIRTVANWRCWCDIMGVEAGYISRHSPLISTGLLTIRCQQGASTNSILDITLGLIISLPWYAHKTLNDMSYTFFVRELFRLNPKLRNKLPRIRLFWIYHAVIFLDFHFESKTNINKALDLSNDSEAEALWDSFGCSEETQYIHPTYSERNISSATSSSALLLPHCVHTSLSEHKFTVFIDFVPTFLAVNRLRLLAENIVRFAYQTVIEHRVSQKLMTATVREEHLSMMDEPEAKHLWAAINLARATTEEKGPKFDRKRPGLPTDFRFAIQNGVRVPLAQPAWSSKLEPPIANFKYMLLAVNHEQRSTLMLRRIKYHWLQLPWGQHQSWALSQAENEAVNDVIKRKADDLSVSDEDDGLCVSQRGASGNTEQPAAKRYKSDNEVGLPLTRRQKAAKFINDADDLVLLIAAIERKRTVERDGAHITDNLAKLIEQDVEAGRSLLEKWHTNHPKGSKN